MGTPINRLVLLASVIAFARAASPSAFSAPDTLPNCASPQALNPAVPVGGTSGFGSAIAWSGLDHGIVFSEGGSLKFQRIYADGTPAAPPVAVTGSSSGSVPSIEWTGTEYAVAYLASFSGFTQVFFVRLDRNGAQLAAPIRVSATASTPTANATAPTVAWNGNGYIVAWIDSRNPDQDIFYTILTATGAILSSDFSLPAAGSQTAVASAWSTGLQRYVLAWTDFRSGVRNEIYTTRITTSGSANTPSLFATGAGNSSAASLADNGANVGVAWTDSRDGNSEIYFSLLGPSGNNLGLNVRVTSDTNSSGTPTLLWTGSEYGLFFQDGRGSASAVWDLFFQRVSSGGVLLGSVVQLTSWASANLATASFAERGFLALYVPHAPTLALSVGCSTPTFPGCPEAPDAYNISGTGATVSWLPAFDRSFDIAYYEVYRNNTRIGTTSANFYNDTGLSPGVTYQYNFRTVNAAQLTSTGCQDAEVHVKSSAALSLGVDKNGNDIDLTWNEDGTGPYRVMRGTSPQVMTEIARTPGTQSTDAGAVLGTVCYFYSIDEPPPPTP